MTPDLVIVGGGPAGLATAIAAAGRGLSVTVCDAREAPIDKGCGEGLMPDAVRRLANWGVDIAAEQRHDLEGIRYCDGDLVAAAPFSGIPGWGVRRPVLHRALVERASELGVELRWATRATGIESDGVATETGTLRGRWIVGADGLHSRVRRWAGLEIPPTNRPPRFGNRRHYEIEPWSPFVEVHWSDHAEAYVTPVSAREVGVAVLWSGQREGLDGWIERFPSLGRRLRGRSPSTKDRGAGALEQSVRAVWRDRVLLVGDASGYVDAITGEGLAAAFHQAERLAEALASDAPERYARAHRSLLRFPNTLIRALLLVERHPGLRRRMVATLARQPQTFRRLLAVHAGEAPIRSLFPGTLVRLGAGLARNPTPIFGA